MPTREQLKERAKMTFRANYGNCVATFLIAMLLIGVSFYTGIGAILVAIPLELGLLCYFLMVFQGAVDVYKRQVWRSLQFDGTIWFGIAFCAMVEPVLSCS